MVLVFDAERELTLRELILIQRLSRGDWEALNDLVQLRAVDPPSREDLELLPQSEVEKLIADLAEVIKKARVVSVMLKAH